MAKENRTTAVVDYDRKITDEDRLAFSQKLGELDAREEELEGQRKAAAAGFKAKLEDNTAERKLISRMLRTGVERMTGECEVVSDFKKKVIIYKLVATGKEVYRREMTDAEYSLPSFGGDVNETR